MVKLYTTSRLKNCPVCDMKKFLHKHNIEYQEIDSQLKEKLGMRCLKTKKIIFPQLLIGEVSIVGWLP